MAGARTDVAATGRVAARPRSGPARILPDVLADGLRRNPHGPAVRDAAGEISYRDLDIRANGFARALADAGVRACDRVAIWLPKSIDVVAAMQGALRLGAAYVPVDPLSPAPRARQILLDGAVRACVTEPGRIDGTLGEGAGIPTIVPGEVESSGEAVAPPVDDPHALAYILYTSGSTGSPKGVCISHRNALAFVDWVAREIEPTPADRFSGHAPFHFDLSVLDLYVALGSGACVCLVPEGAAYLGPRLVELVRRERITVWYSVPSALAVMMEAGGLLEPGPSALRAILFAGEPFPVAPLRRLRRRFPSVRLLNLYGPTETNVCTFHEVGEIPDDQAAVPIGRACSEDRVWAERDDGGTAEAGERGELLVDGPTVMLGYWGRPAQRGPYRTGDIVECLDDETYGYVGRRDAMVKIRGNRVELGEVEAALGAHPGVREVAAVAVGTGPDARLVAAVSLRPGGSAPLLELKRECALRLPRYMIVHAVHELPALPRTANGKVDRRALQTLCEEALAP